jgi:hypothetical protein
MRRAGPGGGAGIVGSHGVRAAQRLFGDDRCEDGLVIPMHSRFCVLNSRLRSIISRCDDTGIWPPSY